MKLTIDIDDKEFEDLMGSCASNYWAEIVREYSSVFIREHRRDDQGASGPWIELTDVNRSKGLQLMASRYPKHFGAFLAGQWDGATADVWLQLAVLGEIKYG